MRESDPSAQVYRNGEIFLLICLVADTTVAVEAGETDVTLDAR
jgi:hypothetical protein